MVGSTQPTWREVGGVPWLCPGGRLPGPVVRRNVTQWWLGLGTSPGHQRVLTGIPVGILMGHMTHGSGSPVATGRRGSGYGFYGGGYPP